MHNVLRAATATLVWALIFLTADHRTTTPEVSAAIYDFSAADAAAADAVSELGLAGGTLTLTRDDDLLFQQNYGTYTPTTLMPIASSSKWLSGATIMTLVDDGLIDLDAPISTYLPGWTGVKGTITMQQLFSHTSGLKPDADCQGNYSITLAQCTDEIYAEPQYSTPGTEFWYGGASMQVGGRIAEVVTGQTWAELFEERIAGPIGMDATFYWGSPNPQIGGSVLSTGADYTRFLQMLAGNGVIDGVTVLSPAAITEMHLDQTAGAAIVASPRGPNVRYGIGNWRDIVDGQGNAVQNSSPGLFSFNPWYDFLRGYGGVFGVYTQGGGVGPYVNQMQAATRAALVDADGDEVGDAIDVCPGFPNPTNNLNTDRNFTDLTPPKANDDLTWPNSDSPGDACDTDDDNDGRLDGDEATACNGGASDPLLRDTDGDRRLDAAECALGSNPNDVASVPASGCIATGDADADGLRDTMEFCFYNTNTSNTNTDGDTCGDGREVMSMDQNTTVNAADLGLTASAFGSYGTPTAPADLWRVNMDADKNGAVNAADLGLVASKFGACP